MELLYSNILPVGLEENQKTIQDCFADQIANCDGVEIAVGYVSKASLEQLDALVEQYHIPHRRGVLVGRDSSHESVQVSR